MKQGIYITANDRVLDQAIALLNSIRHYDPTVPVTLIPYSDQYQVVAKTLADYHGVQLFEDLGLIERLSRRLQKSFGDRFFDKPNNFRKYVCWFGEFDQFLYIDTDIVVFSPIIQALADLQTYDFICCDYQHRGGIQHVFTPEILVQQVFTPEDCLDLFNAGFWGAKKELFTEAQLYAVFEECAMHPEYFDFSKKGSDQPIFNYMILKYVSRRFNQVRNPKTAAGSWAGSPHFVVQEDMTLIDPTAGQPLPYLHWASIRIQSGCPYWPVWQHYRNLDGPPMAQPTETGGAGGFVGVLSKFLSRRRSRRILGSR